MGTSPVVPLRDFSVSVKFRVRRADRRIEGIR
jgi:hypothetical protein